MLLIRRLKVLKTGNRVLSRLLSRLYQVTTAQQTVNLFVVLFLVGVTRFELATTRPPDAYSKPG